MPPFVAPSGLSGRACEGLSGSEAGQCLEAALWTTEDEHTGASLLVKPGPCLGS